ncbi:MAG: RecQ family ATP-dependent DNA helicase, partial [Calditrichaeota bacterium]|nr:RecQ family ATP-dependent DNA helicase [Calditrichota bacterium]
MIKKAKHILKKQFGYDEFRPLQAEVIESILSRKDTLVVMPTGGGKSLCYQIPALLFDGLTIVVSPLISLMKDQVDQLRENGVAAVVLNSSLSPQAYAENVQKIISKTAKLLYIAPESLVKRDVQELLQSVSLDCFTIDEAHCISEWGHDFRPEYRQLATVRRQFPDAVCVALTATATPQVQQDICNSLNFRQENVFIASFNRENLFLQVVKKEQPRQQLLEFLKKFDNQSGIIYCATRNTVEDLAETLKANRLNAMPYHAGLGDLER